MNLKLPERTSICLVVCGTVACMVSAGTSSTDILPVVAAKNVCSDGTVVLGSDGLTSGIPGRGPLSNDEISEWLSDPENHKTLKLKLPVGLDYLPDRLAKIPTRMTRAKVELGRQLFFDNRLSLDHTTQCASCHDPDHGYTVPTRFGIGVAGQKSTRNPPTLINRVMFAGIGEEEFWDGHAASLEDAVLISITDPAGMANTLDRVVKTLRNTPGYAMQFEKVYGGVTIAGIGDAVASFIRVIVADASPYDYERAFQSLRDVDPTDLQQDEELAARYKQREAARDANPMSESALAGMELFYRGDKAWCIGCHASPALTDNMFHNIGVGMRDRTPDLGRFLVTRETKKRGAFKTPPLRNVSMTGPYMHDGRFKTLDDVLKYYGSEKIHNPHLDSRFEELRLTEEEQKQLVDFIKSCTGRLPQVERSRLPK